MIIPYEGQEADPILQGFRQRAVSNTLEGKRATSRDTSAPTSGSAPNREQILQKFTLATVSPTDMPSFVPMDTLTELIHAETVSMALAEAGCHGLSIEKCANIADTLPRVFATLLLIGNVEAILEFKSQGFNDGILPLLRRSKVAFEGREKQGLGWNITVYRLSDEPYGGISKVSRCFKNPSLWTLDKFNLFYNAQWLFSAPVFDPEKFEYILAPQSPLPFTTITPHHAGGALYSQVYMANIHPAHLSWKNTVRV